MKHILAAALVLVCISPTWAANVQKSASSNWLDSFQLDGKASRKDGAIVLTDAAAWQTGTAFVRVDSIAEFDVTFTMRFSGEGDPADGIAFCIHNDPRGALAVGAGGGFLGYGKAECWGVGGIENSIAVEFDNYLNEHFSDPAYDHVGIDINGSVTSAQTARLPFQLLGSTVNARVSYDGAALTVYAWPEGGKQGEPLLRYQTDLPWALKSGSAWMGFTAATGTFMQRQEILRASILLP